MNDKPIIPILEVAGLRGERYGLTIMQSFIVPLRFVGGDWQITGQIPRKLADYLPVFISQHDALIEKHGIPVTARLPTLSERLDEIMTPAAEEGNFVRTKVKKNATPVRTPRTKKRG